MKIIFLDIDGVLNHRGTTHAVDSSGDDATRGWTGMSPECVTVLSELVAKTGAELVLSSTWRYAVGIGGTSRCLIRQGFKPPTGRRRVFAGETPRLGGLARGYEIQAWLDANPPESGEQQSFVILDDDDDMAHLLPRLVQTNPFDGGLTAALADRAAAMLEAGSP